MRRLGLVLSILAALGLGPWAWIPGHAQVGPPNTIQCNQLTNTTLTGTGSPVTTSVLAGSASKIIVICGWHVTESGTTAGTFQLEYGTQGGPCTSPTTITPGYSVSSTAPATDHIDYASLSIPSGAQLCVITTGASTSTLQIGIWVAQF
jgi:hypothetical protein